MPIYRFKSIALQRLRYALFWHVALLLIASGPSIASAQCEPPASLKTRIQTQPRASGFVQLAEWYDSQKQFDCAVDAYRAALKLQPTSVAALDGLSKHLIAEGKNSEAVELLLASGVDLAHEEKLAIDAAQAYGKSGMVDAAGDLLKKAIAVHPQSFPLTFAFTTVLMNKRLVKQAVDVAAKYAAAHPQNLDAQRLYLRTLITSQDLSRAGPLARQLLSTHPQDAYFLYANGVVEVQNGNYAQAKSHLQQSVSLDPDFSSAHLSLGIALEKSDDNAGAKHEFEKVLALPDPPAEVHFELARVLKALGQTGEAQNHLDTYRQLNESQAARSLADVKTAEADQAQSAGQSQKAADLYREALQATPDDAVLNYKLSVALGSLGDTAAERAALEKAIQLDADLALAQNQLGYLDSRLGDFPSAEAHFRRAVQAAPTYAPAWINLAATLATESKFAEADSAIGRALKLDPKNDQALQLKKDIAAAYAQPK